MTMSPFGNVECDYFIVTLNHWSYPNFGAGGIQVQRWHGESCLSHGQTNSQAPLAADQEVISWIQRISLADGNLKFEVLSGASNSWGNFGNSDELTLSHPSELSRLNEYRPAVSLEQSGIAYAGNRVSSLVLTRLEWETADGDVHELVAPIDIATDLNP
jgi:hypothetical protein